MPFHFHSSSTTPSQNNAQPMPLGAGSGILQATQSLGFFGAPTSNLHHAISGKTTTGTDRRSSSSTSASSSNIRESEAATRSGHSTVQSPRSPIASSSGGVAMNQQQQFETPRRARQEDLHPPSNAASMSSPRNPLSPRDYAGTAPRISLEQATPESSQYHAPAQLPASLQPGRPGAISVNTAPAVPLVSQSSTQDQYASPSRSSTVGVAHNYTRSSPATGFEGPQGYSPFSPTTPNTDQAYFAGGSNSKYMPAQRAISNTPLGLADIRPRADSGISEGGPGSNPYSYDGANATPTNSNYLAPWAIYAFDWCKWPAQNHDAGKLAVGSYLEDGHNFVSLNFHSQLLSSQLPPKLTPSDPNTRLPYSTYPSRVVHSGIS